MRSGKNSINEYSLKKNLFGSLENQDININECNLDKCQNFINSKSNDLIIMENYGIDDDIYNYEIYEYNIELKIMNNCKINIWSHSQKRKNLKKI